MAVLLSVTALLWATVCIGAQIPHPVRRQDTSTTTQSAAVAVPTICGDIIDNVNEGYNFFYASAVFECLVSVPFNDAVALRFLDYYNTTMQFQSTLAYLRDPPTTYQQPPVDFAQQLEDIKNNVTSGVYLNQYAFEADVQHLVQSLHDAHVYLQGGASSAFSFGSDRALMTLSVDGVQTPEIYFQHDVVTGPGAYDISPVSLVNGEDVVDFLTRFAALNSYGSLEPHGDWNQIMYSPVQDILEVYDAFTMGSTFYWGDALNFTMKDGSEVNTYWTALYTNADYTGALTTGGDYYNYFVLGLLPASYDENTTLPCPWVTDQDQLAQQCPGWTYDNSSSQPIESWFNVTRGSYPPDPNVVQENLALGSGSGIVTGYILDHISVGVLSIPSFDELGWDIGNFSQAVTDFINAAQNASVAKIVIDLQGNAGGAVELALMTYSQFFPQYYPFMGSRRRSHELADVLGTALTEQWINLSLATDPAYKYGSETGEWIITDRINAHTGRNFSSWAEYYGPREENGDAFSLVEQYDLSNVEFDYEAFGQYAPSNYLGGVDRSDELPPWLAENVIILTDGTCSSTCTLFVEMITQQAGVRTVVVGGRPVPGPMQATSGSRGALAYSGQRLDTDFADALTPNPALASVLPALDNATNQRDTGIYLTAAGLNLRDQVRTATGGPPLQFLYDAADCRLYWTLANALNMTRLWADAAGAIWGLGLNASCVSGSTGYASRGNVTATNAAPENTATSVASLPVVEWDYNTSPSEADHVGLEDGNVGETRLETSAITPCSSTQLESPAPWSSSNVCHRIQLVCKGGNLGNVAYAYLPPCTGICSSGLFCNTQYTSPSESGNPQQLVRGWPVRGATYSGRQTSGWCVPKPEDQLTMATGLGCPI